MQEFPLVAASFVPIPIALVEYPNIISTDCFATEELVPIGTLFRTKRSQAKNTLLASAELEVTVGVEYAVAVEDLAVFVDRRVAVHAEELMVRVGLVGGRQLPERAPLRRLQLRIPLVVPETMGKEPVSDWLHTQNQPIVHYTVTFNNQPAAPFKLRAKLNRAGRSVEITSLSAQPVDLPRIRESSRNMVAFSSQMIGRLVALLRPKPAANKEEPVLATNLSETSVVSSATDSPSAPTA